MFKMTPTGKGSAWILDHAVMIIYAGLSGPEAQADGVIQPYKGVIMDTHGKKELYKCYGANWSRIRGELESWYYNEMANDEQ